MSLGVSYMGTKRHLVGSLVEIVSPSREGPFLDLFSGMCTVGSAIASQRQVWSNDLQIFSHLCAMARFCSREQPLSAVQAADLSAPAYRAHMINAKSSNADVWQAEADALEAGDINTLASLFDQAIGFANKLDCTPRSRGHYDLFLRRFAGTYFSYSQAAEIDGIRSVIDALRDGEIISEEQWRWLLIALCVAMGRCANTTGHFAQALYPKVQNKAKILSQRRRSIYHEWLIGLGNLNPVGSPSWRRRNLAFRSEATDLLKRLTLAKKRPSVVYADPPYTQDQYSRYYHIYETLVLYDYPSCAGRGLYRPDRAVSSFSLASKVESALIELVEAASATDCTFVLSYPTGGLLPHSDERIPEMIKSYFGTYPERYEIAHRHSTLGASKGRTQHDVTEVVYRVASSQ